MVGWLFHLADFFFLWIVSRFPTASIQPAAQSPAASTATALLVRVHAPLALHSRARLVKAVISAECLFLKSLSRWLKKKSPHLAFKLGYKKQSLHPTSKYECSLFVSKKKKTHTQQALAHLPAGTLERWRKPNIVLVLVHRRLDTAHMLLSTLQSLGGAHYVGDSVDLVLVLPSGATIDHSVRSRGR